MATVILPRLPIDEAKEMRVAYMALVIAFAIVFKSARDDSRKVFDHPPLGVT